jgi:aspartyl-tRNA(Asn)/glutamyl-tRNA(Gln) amidotransferase subunit B
MLAIAAEARRHISLLSSGQLVLQETRGFDDARGETFRLRGKEDAPDYRYMPDPNIPPLLLTEAYVGDVRREMPELPVETRKRLMERGLKERDVDVLMAMDAGREIPFDGEGTVGHGELQRSQYPAVAYFDEVAKGREAKVVANW